MRPPASARGVRLSAPGLPEPAAFRTIDSVAKEVVQREELQAAIAARRELGEEHEPAIVDGFVERIEQRLRERGQESEKALKRRRDHQREMVLGAMGISV